MRVFITGSKSFIGQNLLPLLISRDHQVCWATRRFSKDYNYHFNSTVSKNIEEKNIFTNELKGAEAVIHLAAQVQSTGQCFNESLAELRFVNTECTLNIARQAAFVGIRRFIFISTISLQDRLNSKLKSNVINDMSLSKNPYQISKLEAEIGLRDISQSAGMSVVIIRPPLVYGPRNPRNMERLFNLVGSGIPLPFSALDKNRRSFVGVSNLNDLILLCLEHPAAANQTFHVSDDEDISTAELLRRMGKALGKPVRNLPIPQAALKVGLRLLGKGDWVDKLCGDLRVDIEETKRLLGWRPKVTMEEELARTAQWWRERQGRG